MAVYPEGVRIPAIPGEHYRASTERFIARVSRELLTRRAGSLGRCAACGDQVGSAEDFMRVHGRLTHVRCTPEPRG